MSEPEGRAARRILIVAPNWLGDIVMALPAIADIRQHFSEDHLVIAASSAMAPLFRSVPAVDAILPQQGGRRGVAAAAAAMAAGRFDVVILLPNSFRSAWVARRAGIGERWGYRADLRGWLLTRAVRRPPGRDHRHHVDYYRALLRALDIPPAAGHAALVATSAQRARAAAVLERHHVASGSSAVAIAPGATHGFAKRWLPERFAEIARRVTAELGHNVLLVGSPGDRAAGRAIESALAGAEVGPPPRGRIVNLIGQTDLPELIGVLAGCETCVSNDTGAMHVAAALGLPVVALFGPSDERATAPLGRHEILSTPVRCRPCLLRDCPIDHRCMTGIQTADVFDALARLGGRRGHAAVSS